MTNYTTPPLDNVSNTFDEFTSKKINMTTPRENQTILVEIGEKTNNIEAEIKRILSNKSLTASRIELLIDGSVFSSILSLDKFLKAEFNKILNKAAAVIIYRASPK